MRLLSTILLFALLLISCRESYEEPSPVSALPERDKFHLFLLAGQSNMAGRGDVSEQDREIHPRVLSFNRDGEWIPAVDPLHWDKPSAGVGLGRSFAFQLGEADPEITVGLIPAASGGSYISAWAPGGYHDQTDSHPYDEAIERARAAMKDGELKAILWHQGESDAEPEHAAVYKEKLRAVIAQFREDLQLPDLPFIIGQLGQFDGKPWNEYEVIVDQAHRELAEEMPNVAFVSAEGLTPKDDMVHFDAASLREFGKRYAEVYIEQENNPQSAD